MKTARDYIIEYDPALERLEALVERVQRDAYAAGARAAADQMIEIAEETNKRTDRRVREVLSH